MANTTSGSLTTAQLAAIRNDVTANSDLNALPRNDDGFFEMAALYNRQAAPSFTVWKSFLSEQELRSAMDATEVDALGQLQLAKATFILSAGGMDPGVANNRAFWDKIFAGANGATTRAALLVLYKRFATRIEKLLATGTGSDAVPAIMGFEGEINRQDIAAALAN